MGGKIAVIIICIIIFVYFVGPAGILCGAAFGLTLLSKK